MHGQTKDASGSVILDLSGVHAADGSVVALLVELRNELAARGVKAELVGANESVETIVSLIGSTTTKAGLRIRTSLDKNLYQKAIRVSDEEMAKLGA